MKWLCGCDTMPPTGLPHSLGIEFVDNCMPSCACRPSISTCTIALKLALHYNTEEKMVIALKNAIFESHGFDDL